MKLTDKEIEESLKDGKFVRRKAWISGCKMRIKHEDVFEVWDITYEAWDVCELYPEDVFTDDWEIVKK